ncbi:hypothetical protein CICLE_v10024637mg [Citrus x clementina]|uniref:Uncharacterized protein n=1 Tax=Citrus clementina TaxID=85681 RepID=V4U3J3_CITCL|nr:hypothetical protein CICLE_v10024637mg [Citrus x clementina]
MSTISSSITAANTRRAWWTRSSSRSPVSALLMFTISSSITAGNTRRANTRRAWWTRSSRRSPVSAAARAPPTVKRRRKRRRRRRSTRTDTRAAAAVTAIKLINFYVTHPSSIILDLFYNKSLVCVCVCGHSKSLLLYFWGVSLRWC